MSNITLQCEDICSPGRCTYPIPPDAHPGQQYKDCEAALNAKDKSVLDYVTITNNPVETLNLTTEYCMDLLQLKITCITPRYQKVYKVYRAMNETKLISTYSAVNETSSAFTSSDQLLWLLLIPLILGVILVCYCCLKSICRSRGSSGQRENELATLNHNKSVDPNSPISFDEATNHNTPLIPDGTLNGNTALNPNMSINPNMAIETDIKTSIY
ncbi:hypothetical protein MHYP_G00309660 [Metynnis hypsauchen]